LAGFVYRIVIRLIYDDLVNYNNNNNNNNTR